MTAVGFVHGRFQPFHNGHLAYLRGAAARCERLVIGITNPDRRSTRPETTDDHRHLPSANPFTYAERAQMIAGVLRAESIDAFVVPFPISDPELWPDYVPPGAVHFLRVFDAWGETKVERLRAAGHEVVVLDEGSAKKLAGIDVRRLISVAGPWQALVPPAVVPVVEASRLSGAHDLRHAS
jgi:cytidyltransferase-like protein